MVCNRSGIVCAFCVLYSNGECREKRNCKFIQQGVDNISIILVNKSTMGNFSSNTGSFSERKESDGGNVRNNGSNNIYNSLLTPTRKTMAETMALGWKLLFFLGYSIWGVSLLTAWKVELGEINFDSIPAPYKSVMYFFSCVFLATQIWRNYQKGRKDKIENDEAEYHFHQMKKADEIKSHQK